MEKKDMTEKEFWTEFWRTVALLLGVLIIASFYSCNNRRAIILEATKAGVDPVRFACAADGSNASTFNCILLAQKAEAK
jgi:hypothetical protein